MIAGCPDHRLSSSEFNIQNSSFSVHYHTGSFLGALSRSFRRNSVSNDCRQSSGLRYLESGHRESSGSTKSSDGSASSSLLRSTFVFFTTALSAGLFLVLVPLVLFTLNFVQQRMNVSIISIKVINVCSAAHWFMFTLLFVPVVLQFCRRSEMYPIICRSRLLCCILGCAIFLSTSWCISPVYRIQSCRSIGTSPDIETTSNIASTSGSSARIINTTVARVKLTPSTSANIRRTCIKART
eukprot:14749_1